MLNSSTHPLVRPSAPPVLGGTHRLTTPTLFRAPAKSVGHADSQRTEKPSRSTELEATLSISAALRLFAEGRSGASRIGRFETGVIDSVPALLHDSYRLRHQVYCVEREFLSAADYQEPIEIDEYDACSVHVGATDIHDTLVGTARLILPVQNTLPTLKYCPFPVTGGGPLWDAKARWVEVSRLSVSRSYRAAVRAADGTTGPGTGDRAHVFLAIQKALYQASKRLDATHWLVSIERPLQRLLARAGFPLRQLGPAFDYLGTVVAYSMDLREFEDVIATGRYPALADFVAGLPPRPRLAIPQTMPGAGSPLDQLSLAG